MSLRGQALCTTQQQHEAKRMLMMDPQQDASLQYNRPPEAIAMDMELMTPNQQVFLD